MKTCIDCNVQKSLDDFHKNSKMADGHLGRCKACCRALSKEYFQTKHGKEVRRRNRKLWRTRNPEKRRAHKILENAVKSGKVVKPTNCELCGEEKLLHGHHEDYSRPLNVVWACEDCHRDLHRGEAE